MKFRFQTRMGVKDIFKDYKALWKALVVTLAISAVWYGIEFMQYGTLQWDRKCDNVVGFIYLIALWYAYHSNNNLINEIIKICKSSRKPERNEDSYRE